MHLFFPALIVGPLVTLAGVLTFINVERVARAFGSLESRTTNGRGAKYKPGTLKIVFGAWTVIGLVIIAMAFVK